MLFGVLYIIPNPTLQEGAERIKAMTAEEPKRVTAHYIKSSQHRIIHASGMWGGITPQGEVRIAMFHEFQKLPDRILYSITEVGALQEIQREGGGNPYEVDREVEVDIIMSVGTARALRAWLDGHLKRFEEGKPPAREEESV